MKQLETNDWLVLNSIIYKIYTMEDFDGMRKTLLEQLKMVLDFDSADFFLANTDGKPGLIRPVAHNCDCIYPQTYDELDYSRGIMYGGKSLIYRETDIISDEKRMETTYYKKVYIPNNWHFSLQMILAREKDFLGVITFYRTIGKDNFHYDDIFLLDMLKDHLAFRLYQERESKSTDKLTVTQAAEQYGLTRREETILGLLVEGEENGAICEKLVISINTLKKHMLNIYRKMGIKHRVQIFKIIQ
ncbi:helix-turn-helix domain-containing protein [Ethanoligenens harbinense]|uniref:ATP-dependent transcriptional regulator, MalT-like, LuxR family n=1 Tax=Ethanoligenens harbinense (strain DSM 18485 / JCM 12961 / CGMCC 1.5033 / YUAN-3) TaxID=663278 RepID=E6U9G8_ETHHY|nr:LuxR C-terminal-related transcriptional regulator [Ethanoligenens harbinense]ADU26159.1 ATP-dependent transcriptional regulator, MalT-like, LuxR family [Ethanoligenens harbinense YUAN-3]AVQ95299.1 helix-turn-helix transcriptional regulator [Ethanoligenens harbinense YUAN-3]AYF37963.1 helix-turn-helix transcriptional regulator [Ethanoligenens harbinense]AYF40710.1 helix-turn-helix transcriptional regulator [Ethanoligenens harbinense]QCN91543.1 helix-turn-helix transcriptional regulator [Etha